MLNSELAAKMNEAIAKATGCHGVWKPVQITHQHAPEIINCLAYLLSIAVVEDNRQTHTEKP